MGSTHLSTCCTHGLLACCCRHVPPIQMMPPATWSRADARIGCPIERMSNLDLTYRHSFFAASSGRASSRRAAGGRWAARGTSVDDGRPVRFDVASIQFVNVFEPQVRSNISDSIASQPDLPLSDCSLSEWTSQTPSVLNRPSSLIPSESPPPPPISPSSPAESTAKVRVHPSARFHVHHLTLNPLPATTTHRAAAPFPTLIPLGSCRCGLTTRGEAAPGMWRRRWMTTFDRCARVFTRR